MNQAKILKQSVMAFRPFQFVARRAAKFAEDLRVAIVQVVARGAVTERLWDPVEVAPVTLDPHAPCSTTASFTHQRLW